MTRKCPLKLIWKEDIKIMRILEKIFHRLVAFMLIIIVMPLAILIAIVIKLDSKGPVFFCQERVGKDFKKFIIYKFRTMYVHETVDQKIIGTTKSETDNRITNVGRLLRKSSLDELPQLLNIFFGQMNFVGPRPILPEQLNAISDPQHRRFAVFPGITGLSQVRGRRSLHWHQQLRLDAFYVKSRSLKLDIFIILRTFEIVLNSKDIYGSAAKNWREYLPKENGENYENNVNSK